MRPALLFSIFLSLSVLTGCPPGEQKTGDGQTLHKGLLQSEDLESELIHYSIDLNQSVGDLDSAKYTATDLDEIRRILEEYVLLSGRILKFADTRVVEFPQQNEVRRKRNTAAQFLGQVYAAQNRDLSNRSVLIPEVDQAEFEARYKRAAGLLGKWSDRGLKGIDSVEKAHPVLSRFSNAQLNEFSKDCQRISTDFMQMSSLAKRNRNWNLSYIEVLTESLGSLAGFEYHLGREADEILAARKRKSS